MREKVGAIPPAPPYWAPMSPRAQSEAVKPQETVHETKEEKLPVVYGKEPPLSSQVRETTNNSQ